MAHLPRDRDFVPDADACIVGSGASAALTAAILTRAGLQVVVVEQGDWLPPNAIEGAGLLEATPALIPVGDTWEPRGHPWTTVNVGGGAVFYGAASFRYRDIDFHEADGPSWPIGSKELRPWYDWVEREIGVARQADEPLLPDADAPVLPAHPASPAGRLLTSGGRALGWRPFATPLAINSVVYRDRPACNACSPCSGFACESNAKASPVLLIREALTRGALLLPRHRAVRLHASRQGAVDELEIVEKGTGRVRRVRASVFVLGANAVQSAALLLRSPSPSGSASIGNESDLVGRNLCFKVSEYVCGHHPALATPRPFGPFTTVAFLDFYEQCPMPLGGSARGGLMYEAGQGWNEPLPEAVNLRVEAMTGDTPNPNNRVTLLRDSADVWGLPELVLDYSPDPSDLARLEALCVQAERLLASTGATGIQRIKSDFATGAYHLHGTCRFGVDPNTSVLDLDCRLHWWKNVYVVDGSFMPTPGSVNPTLTIQANAARVAHTIVRALRSGS